MQCHTDLPYAKVISTIAVTHCEETNLEGTVGSSAPDCIHTGPKSKQKAILCDV